jgi:hypothetical protein
VPGGFTNFIFFVIFCKSSGLIRVMNLKWMTSSAVAALALFSLALPSCDKKTADDLKEKAEDAKQTVEAKAKEGKEAASKQIDKVKEAAKQAQPKLEEMAGKAKDATLNAIEATKDTANSAAEKVKDAVNASPSETSPTPSP